MTLPSLQFWDVALIVVAASQATLLAYLHHPKWKALMLALPIPFTLASLAVGHPIDVTNIAGLALLLLFTHAVRFFYKIWNCPIVLAIMLAALLQVGLAVCLARILPRTELFFWCMVALAGGGSVAMFRLMPHRIEPGHRTLLPVWLKWPAIALVILLLVLAKKQLQGFMTVFPMVGVIAAYEARYSLWTVCRQMPVLVLSMLPMLVAIRLVQPWLGPAWALIPGWLVFLCVLIPVTRRQWRADYGA